MKCGGSSPLARGLLHHGILRDIIERIIPARAGFTATFTSIAATRSDHPRSRGVYEADQDAREHQSGSSPLARGLHSCPGWMTCWMRIIPARAGFTRSRTCRTPWSADHPRSRGVYYMCTYRTKYGSGSSPLARGLRGDLLLDHDGRGIIPARAGFTIWQTERQYNRTGSSPLARGLRVLRVKSTKWPRIIPARAGFTGRRAVPALAVPDHPRSRGVYASSSSQAASSAGSSPLARGLHEKRSPRHPCPGIIPARAGFTPGQPSSRYGTSGSSPLARGLRRADRVSGRRPGIIPARAGFTRRPVRSRALRRDHPRSRGVYCARYRRRPAVSGSSPLARGLRSGLAKRQDRSGIIPARAGFTRRQ